MRQYNFKNGKKLEIGTMFGIGKNYAKHAAEMGGSIPDEPIIFLKPPAAYLQSGGIIKLPEMSVNVHHEVELVVVIGKSCIDIDRKDAVNCIAGYAVGIDVTMRDIQLKAKNRGEPWAVSKGFVNSAPISEIIPSEYFGNEIPDFDLILEVNGEIKQKTSTKNMERQVDQLIEYLSKIFTLEPGDCIFTGTPEGVGRIVHGDKIHAELVGFAELEVDAD